MLNIVTPVPLIAASRWELAAPSTIRVDVADIHRLTDPTWRGSLAYLDDTSEKTVTMASNLMVTPSGADGLSWLSEFRYADQPKANSRGIVILGKEGTR